MILIALGGNLVSAQGDPPRATLYLALTALRDAGVTVLDRSRWFETRPVPVSDQPNFINAAASLATSLSPKALLETLHDIEARFGRLRGERNAARPLDLDLLAYHEVLSEAAPILPHPRLHERAFVLFPLRDVAPDWRHPRLQKSVSEMIAALPPGQDVHPLGD